MAFPTTIRVKLISDDAGSITITPVVVQEMPGRELVERILSHCGKDVERILQVLRRGTLVQGASRFSWKGFSPLRADLDEILATFPDAQASRPFDAGRCVLVRLHLTQGGALEVEPQPLQKKRVLQRTAFWDVLVEAAAEIGVNYAGYSYRETADRYRLDLSLRDAPRLQKAANLLAFSNLGRRLQSIPLAAVEFYTKRD